MDFAINLSTTNEHAAYPIWFKCSKRRAVDTSWKQIHCTTPTTEQGLMDKSPTCPRKPRVGFGRGVPSIYRSSHVGLHKWHTNPPKREQPITTCIIFLVQPFPKTQSATRGRFAGFPSGHLPSPVSPVPRPMKIHTTHLQKRDRVHPMGFA